MNCLKKKPKIPGQWSIYISPYFLKLPSGSGLVKNAKTKGSQRPGIPCRKGILSGMAGGPKK